MQEWKITFWNNNKVEVAIRTGEFYHIASLISSSSIPGCFTYNIISVVQV